MSARTIPYGYKMENGIIKVNEEESKYVRMIFEMRASGIGVYAIGKKLYEEQIPFFTDTRDKSIKKAGAILYKSIYIGEKGYPAIVDKAVFDKIQAMKTAPIRKPKNEEQPKTIEYEEYEFIPEPEIARMQKEVERKITEHKVDGTAACALILELAAQRYASIKRKEDVL